MRSLWPSQAGWSRSADDKLKICMYSTCDCDVRGESAGILSGARGSANRTLVMRPNRTTDTRTSVLRDSLMLRVIVARPGARPCCPSFH